MKLILKFRMYDPISRFNSCNYFRLWKQLPNPIAPSFPILSALWLFIIITLFNLYLVIETIKKNNNKIKIKIKNKLLF